VRLRLTFSYAAFLTIAGVLLLALAWIVFLRGLPDVASLPGPPGSGSRILVRADLIREFLAITAVALVAFVLIGLSGGWWLAGRMLAPLDRLMDATRRAADGSLSHRIDLPGRSDEFRELADAFDAMLGRLESHVMQQRRFAANASHELRTPLTTTKTMLDVARSDTCTDAQELIRRLSQVNTHAIELTEALLLLSQADARSFKRTSVDMSLLAEEATETLLPLAEGRSVSIATAAGPAPVVGSPTLLMQLVVNLVHNAIVHNLPAGGHVHVTTAATGDNIEIAVENTGDALDPGTLAELTEPFRRGAGRVRSAHAGVGLGLAIAVSIVKAHDGDLLLEARPQGGLRATVNLPGVPPLTT
jgi:two-component system sensor histidine kinase VanS